MHLYFSKASMPGDMNYNIAYYRSLIFKAIILFDITEHYFSMFPDLQIIAIFELCSKHRCVYELYRLKYLKFCILF